jgi:hypothetical protein
MTVLTPEQARVKLKQACLMQAPEMFEVLQDFGDTIDALRAELAAVYKANATQHLTSITDEDMRDAMSGLGHKP